MGRRCGRTSSPLERLTPRSNKCNKFNFSKSNENPSSIFLYRTAAKYVFIDEKLKERARNVTKRRKVDSDKG